MSDYKTRKQSDINWVRASKQFIAPADGTHDVCPIPRNTLVTDIIVVKTTAYADAGATITVGFSGNNETSDPDAFMLSAHIDPDALGSRCMTQVTTALNGGGKHFERGGQITVTCDDNGGAAGTFQVFVCYTQLKN